MGLRLCRAHAAHAIYRRFVRGDHHRLVRLDSAAASAFAYVSGIFSRRTPIYEEHTPETVLEHVVEPAGAGGHAAVCGWCADLQHGRLQAYIFYLLIGLAALIVLALMGGGGQ